MMREAGFRGRALAQSVGRRRGAAHRFSLLGGRALVRETGHLAGRRAEPQSSRFADRAPRGGRTGGTVHGHGRLGVAADAAHQHGRRPPALHRARRKAVWSNAVRRAGAVCWNCSAAITRDRDSTCGATPPWPKDSARLLKHCRPSPEEELARFTGDAIAHEAGDAARAAAGWAEDAAGSLRRNLRDFVQEEARFSPTRVEFDAFSGEVERLRDSVARIGARIEALGRGRTR